MKAVDVFTPGGLPTVTYVDEHLIEKKKQFLNIIETGKTLISISGPSKSGKTVFVEQTLGKGNIIQITGAGVNSSEELWNRVFNIIGTPSTKSTTHGKSTSIGVSSSGEICGNALVAKGKVAGGASGTYTKSSQSVENLNSDILNTIISELGCTGVAIFIDDFHYIPGDVQCEVAKQVKELIRNDVTIICASTPYRADDVIRGNSDLRGRVFPIDFDYWDVDTLTEIAKLGFSELRIKYDNSAVKFLAQEVAGSPQLMQYLCLNICFELGVKEVCKGDISFESDFDTIHNACRITSVAADYSSVVECMKDGPKTRGANRNVYQTVYGWSGDVYKILAKALSLKPPKLTIRYPVLMERVNRVCKGKSPSGSSLINACQNTALIINDKTGEWIVEWDAENDVFDIRDPYLLFYLRWSGSVG